ncbi:MAG: YitT family protein [Mollicutes bacterium]|nr:YitT family protein [Mollicutes bacterium]
MKKIIKIIIGCLLIALSYNIFFLPYDIVPNGIFGFATLLNLKTSYDPALFLSIVNLFLIIISLCTLGGFKSKEYVWPGMLIPLFICLETYFDNYLILESEKIIAVIAGSFITGLGYGIIYKEGKNVGGLDIIQDIVNSVAVYRSHLISYFLEGIVVLLTLVFYGFESMVYTIIVIVVVRYMTTKSKVGISSSKNFFIITTKEEEVKKYIMDELKNDLTEFTVKGGYSKHKAKILMTVMDTKNYYILKEGILKIDPKAFISITDSYEIINKNRNIARSS